MLNPPPHPLTLCLEMHKWSISRTAIIYSLRYSRKNNGHVIPWDLEVVSAWNLKILLTKEIHSLLTSAKIFPCLQNIIGSCDKSNDLNNYLMSRSSLVQVSASYDVWNPIFYGLFTPQALSGITRITSKEGLTW